MPKKVLIALPPAMLEQVDFIASVEMRTRSDLLREALRRYISAFEQAPSPVYKNPTKGTIVPATFPKQETVPTSDESIDFSVQRLASAVSGY